LDVLAIIYYMEFLLLIIFAIILLVSAKLQKGLKFEEYCASLIQNIHHENTGGFIEIGIGRSILRNIVENRLNLLYPNSKMGINGKFLNLRNARILAVFCYEHSGCDPEGGSDNYILSNMDCLDEIIDVFIDKS
jgi:hypothetical protein